jgi:hypothetical protein
MVHAAVFITASLVFLSLGRRVLARLDCAPVNVEMRRTKMQEVRRVHTATRSSLPSWFAGVGPRRGVAVFE